MSDNLVMKLEMYVIIKI